MEQAVILELIRKETKEARRDLFEYKIEDGIKRNIELIQKIMPLARENGREKELNQIMLSLMTAIEQKDYLLFSDMACYEIPALFGKP